jgi:hypothetical protein
MASASTTYRSERTMMTITIDPRQDGPSAT